MKIVVQVLLGIAAFAGLAGYLGYAGWPVVSAQAAVPARPPFPASRISALELLSVKLPPGWVRGASAPPVSAVWLGPSSAVSTDTESSSGPSRQVPYVMIHELWSSDPSVQTLRRQFTAGDLKAGVRLEKWVVVQADLAPSARPEVALQKGVLRLRHADSGALLTQEWTFGPIETRAIVHTGHLGSVGPAAAADEQALVASLRKWVLQAMEAPL